MRISGLLPASMLFVCLIALTGCGSTGQKTPIAAPDIAFMGDSITAYWSLPGLNFGVPGDTTAGMLSRFSSQVFASSATTVIILGGTNDIEQGTNISVIEANIQSMAALSRTHNIKVVLCSVLPRYDDQDYNPTIVQLNQLILAYANQNHLIYLDYYSPLFGHPEAFEEGGLHPNQLGYVIMQRVLVSHVNITQ